VRQVASARSGLHVAIDAEVHGGIVGGNACERHIGPKCGCSVAVGGNLICAASQNAKLDGARRLGSFIFTTASLFFLTQWALMSSRGLNPGGRFHHNQPSHWATLGSHHSFVDKAQSQYCAACEQPRSSHFYSSLVGCLHLFCGMYISCIIKRYILFYRPVFCQLSGYYKYGWFLFIKIRDKFIKDPRNIPRQRYSFFLHEHQCNTDSNSFSTWHALSYDLYDAINFPQRRTGYHLV
jgi:hypothetical protein